MTTDPFNRCWYVLRCFPSGEQELCDWLEAHCDVEVYFPKSRRLVYPRKKKGKEPIEIVTAAFRGYVFVKFLSIPIWQHISDRCAVYQGFLENCRIENGNQTVLEPVLIDELTIAQLRIREHEHDFDDTSVLAHVLYADIIGSVIRIPAGPFQDLPALLVAVNLQKGQALPEITCELSFVGGKKTRLKLQCESHTLPKIIRQSKR